MDEDTPSIASIRAEVVDGATIGYPKKTIGYVLLEKICEDGNVHRGYCVVLNKDVAIKIISVRYCFSAQYLESLIQTTTEVCIHSQILKVHSVFLDEDEKCIWVVMPLLRSMHSFVTGSYPIQESSIAVVLKKILEALTCLHSKSRVHKNLSLRNILVDDCGDVFLADYGLARSTHMANRMFGSPLSTESSPLYERFTYFHGVPYWMAPVCIYSVMAESAVYAVKSDIWAVGIIALELAYGQAPISRIPVNSNLFQIIRNRVSTKNNDIDTRLGLTGFSEAFKDMITKCLSQDPSQRPSSEALLSHAFFNESQDFLQLPEEARPNLQLLDAAPAHDGRGEIVLAWDLNVDTYLLEPSF